jgi:hypothetical protein
MAALSQQGGTAVGHINSFAPWPKRTFRFSIISFCGFPTSSDQCSLISTFLPLIFSKVFLLYITFHIAIALENIYCTAASHSMTI